MPEPTNLDLSAEDGRRLRHKYLKQDGDVTGLVVLLPGDNYGVDGPLLYYLGQTFWHLGWDTAAITYGYQSAGEPFSPMAIGDVLEETRRAIEVLLAERGYTRLVLVGKSLGAALIALLCNQMKMPSWTRAVYLTPPLGPMFNPTFLTTLQPAFIVVGTNDRFFNSEVLQELEGHAHLELLTIENADHSMNINADLAASLAALQEIVGAVVAFGSEDLESSE